MANQTVLQRVNILVYPTTEYRSAIQRKELGIQAGTDKSQMHYSK